MSNLGILAVAIATAGCATVVPPAKESLRVGTVEDLSPRELGFQAGVTTLDEARVRLGERGLTGVVEDALASPSGSTLAVLGADYQSRVLVFRDGRFVNGLELSTHGLPPYDLALRLAANGSSRALFVVYRDPLDRATEPPTMLLFRVRDSVENPAQDSGFHLSARARLERIVARRGGLSRPLFVGADLGDGVMFVARDREGALWDTSYLIRYGAGKLAFEPRPMTEALQCSCVQHYAEGAPKR